MINGISLKNRSVLIILPAQDFNEQEYLIIVNALERAHFKVFIASDAYALCVGSNGLKVKNDMQIYNVHETNFGGIIFIGGSGVRNYWNNNLLHSIAGKFHFNKKPIGAICAAPIILAKAGLITECATCYPDDKKELERTGVEYKDNPVIISNNIITAKDPTTAGEFIKIFLNELAKN
ncbi:MAG: DJ-1/PfpI family protein [Ignavibacteria bacterium]|nr:DJ-1/PfpI family protein [Ignavibacteria bacterium]